MFRPTIPSHCWSLPLSPLSAGLFDYTVTAVNIAGAVRTDGNNNPLEDEAKETVCYTRHIDKWLVDQNAQNEASGVRSLPRDACRRDRTPARTTSAPFLVGGGAPPFASVARN